jgi:hypothetical protein
MKKIYLSPTIETTLLGFVLMQSEGTSPGGGHATGDSGSSFKPPVSKPRPDKPF